MKVLLMLNKVKFKILNQMEIFLETAKELVNGVKTGKSE